MQPNKTLVGMTGRSPIKAVAGSTLMPVRKMIAASTAMKPIKTVVAHGAVKASAFRVGNTAQPVRKAMPGSFGGSNGARPRGVLAAPTSAARPTLGATPRGNSDGNVGKSVASMPPPANGPVNPVLEWSTASGDSSIQSGAGVGLGGKTAVSPKSFAGFNGRNLRKRNSFYGG